jgi:anti-anti-sigma factor
MKYELLDQQDQTTVMFREGLGFADHGVFRHMLGAVEQTSPETVVFDFSDLDTIQTAGLGLLLIARERCEAQGRHLVVSQPRGGVLRVLEAARLDRVLTIN